MDEDGVRAAPKRFGAAHRGVDAEPPRLVVRGRDDPPPVWVTADDERLRLEARILELFDGGEERVEVEVRDDHQSSLDTGPPDAFQPSGPLSSSRSFGAGQNIYWYTRARIPTLGGGLTHHPPESTIPTESGRGCANLVPNDLGRRVRPSAPR